MEIGRVITATGDACMWHARREIWSTDQIENENTLVIQMKFVGAQRFPI